jgi:hypothetical protein
MNVMTFDKIYSLYPYPTFVERRSLKVSSHGVNQPAALIKYEERGWKIKDKVLDYRDRMRLHRLDPFRDGIRFVGDNKTWTLHLDTTGVDVTSTYFDQPLRDSLSMNSWDLRFEVTRTELSKPYSINRTRVWGSPALRYHYLIAPPYNEQVRGVFAAEKTIKENPASFK